MEMLSRNSAVLTKGQLDIFSLKIKKIVSCAKNPFHLSSFEECIAKLQLALTKTVEKESDERSSCQANICNLNSSN